MSTHSNPQVWITLHEMLPSAFKHAGTEGTIISFFLGMFLMSANLYCLELFNTEQMFEGGGGDLRK